MPPNHPETSPIGAEARAHPRFQTKLAVSFTLRDTVTTGHILDIGRGGAFIAVPDSCGITPGEKVRMTLSLPAGLEIKTVGAVMWIRNHRSLDGPPGYGIRFLGLSRTEMAVLEGYLRECENHQKVATSVVGPTQKFFVEVSRHGWLVIKLQGFLKLAESAALRDLVATKLEAWRDRSPLVLIEVSDFQPCPEESLEAIRDWLALMGQQPSFGGVLIGRGTVGILQFRRIAREAEIAGALASFEDEESGVEFLRAAQHTMAGK